MIKSAISPSMMCADLMNLRSQLDVMQKQDIDYLHVDIMDGVFVPNYMLGPGFCSMLKEASPIPLDIHLMVTQPEQKISWLPIGPGDYVSVHVEAGYHILRSLQAIRQTGAKAMAALNPGTPITALEHLLRDIDGVLVMTVNPGFSGQKLVFDALEKIASVRRYLDDRGFYHIDIEVDGNVSMENAAKMRSAGANIFVAGSSSIFSKQAPLDRLIFQLKAACG